MPNLSTASKYPEHKVARSASDTSGPCFEPVSPDEDIRTGKFSWILRVLNSTSTLHPRVETFDAKRHRKIDLRSDLSNTGFKFEIIC